MRKFGKVNTMSTDFADYNYMILGQGGIGKTTMAHEIGKLITGNDEGTFVITLGAENAPAHINGVFNERAISFKKFREIVDDLVANKEDYPYTKFICLDSIDELYRLAEEQVVKEYNASVDVDKRVKSIKQAYGGFQAGENRTVDIVIKAVSDLYVTGYKLIVIGHTKTKAKVDPMSGVSYEQLTCTIDNKYYNAIKDKVNLVATGYYERDFTDLKKKDNPFTKEKNSITVGSLVGQRRVLSLIDDENVIDTKCHFEYIEPKIDFSAQSLIAAVQEAIKKKLADTSETHASTPLPSAQDEEIAKMRAVITEKHKAAPDEVKKVVVEFMKTHGINLNSATKEQLIAVYECFPAEA